MRLWRSARLVLWLALLILIGARGLGAVAAPAASAATSASLASLVDARSGTSGGGHTFPGAEVPFGMVQWSPDTKPTYTEGSEYAPTDHRLWGYSLTHLSGAGCPAAGDVPMLPLTGPLPAGDPGGDEPEPVRPRPRPGLPTVRRHDPAHRHLLHGSSCG